MKWCVVLETDFEMGDWSVWCPELPGCVLAGETEEALENIREAIALYLEPAKSQSPASSDCALPQGARFTDWDTPQHYDGC
ncbi:type II toxin-antitoxin system HicB family antitoxin [Myxacorys almedinensis]|uniref:Type II toxin-antitoxin system HicB family antitoxin n=1 Tax=Myxacorys almedinensis A TaxID=2690445 RepID=A0A8J8CHS8_9CYAN|nr:type II toxin-antitoxin system HicB family antitoxin [Myxacorys almedinensis]NDJ16999.1 type II toxin-antitoxin system HicB family antitoxin [Myxacorys almedinensis A]